LHYSLINLLGDALPESNLRDVPQNVVKGNQHKLPRVPKVRFTQMLGKSPYCLITLNLFAVSQNHLPVIEKYVSLSNEFFARIPHMAYQQAYDDHNLFLQKFLYDTIYRIRFFLVNKMTTI
jgi:hypothetical protein